VRLQTKLTVAFAAVALLPIAALTAVARVVVADRYRADFARQLDDADETVHREYRRLARDVEQSTARVASVDDRLVRPLLIALAKGPLPDDLARDMSPYVG
jgi:hypothetical protein